MWNKFANAFVDKVANEVGKLFEDDEFVGRTVTIAGRSVRILSKLGEGGFAYVYLGEAKGLGKVAVKRCMVQSKDQQEDVNKEIRVMEKLGNKCANIVKFYGSERIRLTDSKAEVLLLMECCSGGSVTSLLQNKTGKFSEKKIMSMFWQIVNAVNHMHKQSPPIAHRDLKVDNLLISGEDGKIKLCDFGSCSTVDKVFQTREEISLEQTHIDQTTTPSYRAPEIVDLYLRKRVNYKVDIWALGVILYALTYGQMPFGQECSKAAILEGEFKIPKTSYPKRLPKLIKMLLHKKPERRPECKEILKHCASIAKGGEGTLKFKKKKKSNLAVPSSANEEGDTPTASPEPSPQPAASASFADGWDPFGESKTEKKAAPQPSADTAPPTSSGTFWGDEGGGSRPSVNLENQSLPAPVGATGFGAWDPFGAAANPAPAQSAPLGSATNLFSPSSPAGGDLFGGSMPVLQKSALPKPNHRSRATSKSLNNLADIMPAMRPKTAPPPLNEPSLVGASASLCRRGHHKTGSLDSKATKKSKFSFDPLGAPPNAEPTPSPKNSPKRSALSFDPLAS